MVGIGKRTLLRSLYEKKIAEPDRLTDGGEDIRLWTEGDIEKVRRYKEANFRKRRGRKKKEPSGEAGYTRGACTISMSDSKTKKRGSREAFSVRPAAVSFHPAL